MPAIQLTESNLRNLKRSLQSQCSASSSHLTEAIASGLGFTTHAALKAEMGAQGPGRYIRFDEDAFRVRLAELSTEAGPPVIALPPPDHAARYVERLLEDPHLEFVELRPMRARFRLSGIDTVVQIDLKDVGDGYVRFQRSHAMHAPGQLGPYWPSRDYDDDAAYGMHRAIESLASYHRQAVQAGHTPSAAWLV